MNPAARATATPPRSRPGLGAGIAALGDGIGFVVGNPRLWGYAAFPLVVAAALTLTLSWLGVAEAASLASSWMGTAAHGIDAALAWALRAVLTVAAVVTAYLVAFSLAQPLSGWALDAIVRSYEASVGLAARPREPALAVAVRALKVSLTSLAVGLPLVAGLTVVGLLVPAAAVVTLPLKFVVSAILVAWDLLDYPLGRRGLGVGARLRWFGAHMGAVLGFGSFAAVVLFIPCAGLLLLPVGVAGATALVVRAERAI